MRFATAKRLITVIAAAFFILVIPAGAEENPPSFEAALDEAVGTARAGDREKASELFAHLAEEYPDEAALFYNLALTYEFDKDGNRYRGENLNQAASYYQQTLVLDPDFTPARYNLAVVWHKLGYLEEAGREYRLVAREGGELASRAEFNLALVLKEKGRPGEAEKVITNAEGVYDNVARVRLLALLAEDGEAVGRAIRLWKRALALDDDPALNALAIKHLHTLRGY